MLFFKEKQKQEYVIIVGCGRLGAKIANELSTQGKNVMMIDKDADSFRRLDSNFGGLNLVGDGTDLDLLKENHIEDASAVLALTNDDNINHIIAQMARTIFGVQDVVLRLSDPEKRCVVEDTNIHVLCPAILSAQAIASVLKG